MLGPELGQVVAHHLAAVGAAQHPHGGVVHVHKMVVIQQQHALAALLESGAEACLSSGQLERRLAARRHIEQHQAAGTG